MTTTDQPPAITGSYSIGYVAGLIRDAEDLRAENARLRAHNAELSAELKIARAAAARRDTLP